MECIARQSTGSCCGDHRGRQTGGGADSELGGLGNWELDTTPRAEPAGPRGKEAREVARDWGPVCILTPPWGTVGDIERHLCLSKTWGTGWGIWWADGQGSSWSPNNMQDSPRQPRLSCLHSHRCRGPESLHPTSTEDTPSFQCKVVPHVGGSHLRRISASNLRHAPRAPGTPSFSLTPRMKRPETRGS